VLMIVEKSSVSAPWCSCLVGALVLLIFFFADPAATEFSTLSLHDALPILFWSSWRPRSPRRVCRYRLSIGSWCASKAATPLEKRSEEHTSELQSRFDLVCRLLLEKKKQLWYYRYREYTALSPATLATLQTA